MEGRWRLGDLLAFAAGELLPHGLNDLPLTRDDLQGLGDILAELRQLGRAAAGAVCRSSDDETLAREMLGERFLGWSLALAGPDGRSIGRDLCCQLIFASILWTEKASRDGYRSV